MKKIAVLLLCLCVSLAVLIGGQGPMVGEASEGQVLRMPTIMGGTYMDWMKTVYNKAGQSDVVQIPLTAYDKDYKLQPIAAESWEVSSDGLVWTFHLKQDLKWSDGTDLTAQDFVFALERAVTQGYDFAWYWSWAGGVKNWSAVEKGEVELSEFGVKAIDAHTIQVETESPKPYFPGVAAFWFPVPRHVVEQYGDEWASSADNYVSSGPFMLTEWIRGDKMVLKKNPYYTAPWKPELEEVILYPPLEDPAVGFPAYLADDVDVTDLNAGQLAYAQKRFPDELKSSLFFGTYYLAYDYEQTPFDNVDVRKAIFYAVDREEVTQTVLKNVATPAYSIYPPGFPGYSEEIVAQTGFDAEKAQEHLAKAGYPNGEGFPKVELWWRIEGGHHAPIVGPLAEYLQGQFKEVLNIDIDIKGIELKTWMDALKERTQNFFLAPYMYDYVDASNFASIFVNGGRHHWVNDPYTELVNNANSLTNWEERYPLYIQAEQILVDEAIVTYLVHPITNKLWKPYVVGEGVSPNDVGTYPNLPFYVWTHISIER